MLQVSRKTRALTAALVAVVVLGAFAANAAALPAKFFGVVPQSSLTQEQFNTLKKGKVKSMRIAFIWSRRPADRGGAFNWSGVDAEVEKRREERNRTAAVPRRLADLGDAQRDRAGHRRRQSARPPARDRHLGHRLDRLPQSGGRPLRHRRHLLDRTPLVPDVPIKNWQIWNEPNFKYFVAKPNPKEYGQLVKISSAAIKSVDPTRAGHPRRAVRQARRRPNT